AISGYVSAPTLASRPTSGDASPLNRRRYFRTALLNSTIESGYRGWTSASRSFSAIVIRRLRSTIRRDRGSAPTTPGKLYTGLLRGFLLGDIQSRLLNGAMSLTCFAIITQMTPDIEHNQGH